MAGFLRDGEPLKAWSLAGALADTYEKYQAWRRDWLLGWERRAPADDWQASLWRTVARGRQHRARRIDAYLARFGAGDEAPLGLPPRLFVFACQNVSPDVLQVIASQARAGTQHFFLHTPARAFWGDLTRWAGDYRPADDDAFLGGEQHNPLLAAWGQAGRDFIAALGSGEAVAASFELAPFAEPPRATLLGRLQADVLDNRAPLSGNVDAPWPRAQVDRDDASLQFHACHTRLREVQVLHDQLRALLDAPPPAGGEVLQPRDIAVLAPDIDPYAPHIEAVFGGAMGTPRELPYTIADASPLASASLAQAFLRLLALPLRAPTLPDVIDLLAVPAIAARFDIDAAATRPPAGLAAAGRRALGPGRGGSRAPARRWWRCLHLRIRARTPAARLRQWRRRRRSPVSRRGPRSKASRRDSVDGLLRFLQVLRDARTRLADAQSPSQWQQALEALLDARIRGRGRQRRCGRAAAPARIDRELRARRRTRRLRRARRACRRAGATAGRTRRRRCARAVPVRRHLFRAHGADAADPVPGDRACSAWTRLRFPRATCATRSIASCARSTRASGARAIPRGATPTGICSCSCSPRPDELWLTFRRIILPNIAPAIAAGAALAFTRAIAEFGATVLISGNIPLKTQVAAVQIFGQIEGDNTAGAAAVSTVLLAVAFVVLLLMSLVQRWAGRRG